ncbi:MAG: phage repressor protein C with HTH and peptisase S24 domain [Granulosicoccus sp.]|jgi:phage repressor protein C with HTH and peptisase S24 domain
MQRGNSTLQAAPVRTKKFPLKAPLAAENGVLNISEDPVEHLAFPSAWLNRLDVRSDKAYLLSVKGTSMEPTLNNGDLVLIDRDKRMIRNGRIYAFNDVDGTSRIKRLDVIKDTAITIRSDADPLHVEQRLGEEMNNVSDGIMGEVVWAAHSLTYGN